MPEHYIFASRKGRDFIEVRDLLTNAQVQALEARNADPHSIGKHRANQPPHTTTT
ncbi:hypothetical protein PBI_WINKY_142 [Mycobacterium phage Winky]|nr:hypothetical protein PBI_WINKY_142 [Mycobacterium phage Winky]